MPAADTIAAIATGAPGAIGIIRLSGERAVQCLARLFRPADRRALTEHPPGALVYGTLTDGEGQAIDRVLATYGRAPATYTGEDTAELHCHGAPLVLALALEALFACGCRQAGAGEFTKRAFLAGKLDLVQAEAVADLIDASSREGVRHAAGQLTGALSRRTEEIYRALVDLTAHFCAALDYPDEDIDPFTAHTIARTLSRQEEELQRLLSTWQRGRQLVQGVPCAIVGRPNAGKSSLLNALLGYDRAIVTPVPGTTRDTLEERLELGGTLLRLIDTAGLRNSADPVERQGIERSHQAMQRAELILFLADRSEPFSQADEALLRQAMALAPTILIRSKGDLPAAADLLPVPEGLFTVELSALTGQGLEALEKAIATLFPPRSGMGYGAILTNLRQAEAAGRALEALRCARQALQDGVTPDAVLCDVEGAMDALGELTGQSIQDDVTDRIFQRFCVGK